MSNYINTIINTIVIIATVIGPTCDILFLWTKYEPE